jgi:hypothetical protein
MNDNSLKKKDDFLRAIQLIRPCGTHDQRLAFGWALNLDEKTIPSDIPAAARRFVARLSR